MFYAHFFLVMFRYDFIFSFGWNTSHKCHHSFKKKKKKCKLIHLGDSQQWLPFNSFQLQDFVQQWWRTGQGDWKGTSGGGLWDVRQGFGSVDCSALCRTYHSHPDIPKHHWAYHELPQQDQAGEERRDYHPKTSPLSVFDNVTVFSRFVRQDLRVCIVDIFVSNFFLTIYFQEYVCHFKWFCVKGTHALPLKPWSERSTLSRRWRKTSCPARCCSTANGTSWGSCGSKASSTSTSSSCWMRLRASSRCLSGWRPTWPASTTSTPPTCWWESVCRHRSHAVIHLWKERNLLSARFGHINIFCPF